MKKLFLGWFLLLTTTCFAENTPIDLPTALASNLIRVSATAAGGIGAENLRFIMVNETNKEIKVRLNAGLHFKASEDGAQDLLILKETLYVLAPKANQSVPLTGYCIEASNYAPRADMLYTYNGFAPMPLKILSDSLKRYPDLTEAYGQMFVWAITDKKTLYDVHISPKLVKPATNIMKYVAKVSGLAPGSVLTINNFKPANTKNLIFSKTAIIALHNPKDQAITFKIYDDKGKVYHTLFENRRIKHGMKEYTFGINELINPRATTSPVFYAKITDASGKVLAQQKVDKNTEAIKPKLTTVNFTFSFMLKKGAKGGKLNVYTDNGTLVEEFKRYEYLPMGNYNVQVSLLHLLPAETKFIAKLEGENGVVFAEQPVVVTP